VSVISVWQDFNCKKRDGFGKKRAEKPHARRRKGGRLIGEKGELCYEPGLFNMVTEEVTVPNVQKVGEVHA